MVHCSNQSFPLGYWKNGYTCKSWYASTDRGASSCCFPSPSYSPVFSIELKATNIQIKVHMCYVMPLYFKNDKNIVLYHIRNFISMYCHGFPPPPIWHVCSYKGTYTRCVMNIRPKRHLLVGQQDSLSENFYGRSLI